MASAPEVREWFTVFAAEAEPRLRYALVAALGQQDGLDATAEALAYGWEHRARVEAMENPIGYLYRVGRSRVRFGGLDPPRRTATRRRPAGRAAGPDRTHRARRPRCEHEIGRGRADTSDRVALDIVYSPDGTSWRRQPLPDEIGDLYSLFDHYGVVGGAESIAVLAENDTGLELWLGTPTESDGS